MTIIQIQKPTANTYIKMQYAITQNGVPMGIGKGVAAKFPILKEHVGFMIGKRGGNVKRIRDKVNVQILIQDDKTDEPWFMIRALFSKNLDAACVELAMLGNRIQDGRNHKYELPAKDNYQECEIKTSFVVVDQKYVGSIIGPGGSGVKAIARECGAFVYIQPGSKETDGRPWFEIKGLYTMNIENAYYAIMQSAMEAQTTSPLFDTTSPTVMMGPKVSPLTQQQEHRQLMKRLQDDQAQENMIWYDQTLQEQEYRQLEQEEYRRLAQQEQQQEQQQVLDSSRHEHHVGHACFAGCATELEIQRAQQAQQEQQQEQQQVLDSCRHEHHVGHACFAGCATELEIQRAQQAQQA